LRILSKNSSFYRHQKLPTWSLPSKNRGLGVLFLVSPANIYLPPADLGGVRLAPTPEFIRRKFTEGGVGVLKSRVQSLERKRQEGFRLDGLHRVKPFGEVYPPQLARHRRGETDFAQHRGEVPLSPKPYTLYPKLYILPPVFCILSYTLPPKPYSLFLNFLKLSS